MRKVLVIIFLGLALLPIGHITALANDTTELEIQHLLDFIADSSCTFIRNGSEYPASEARTHIERKYAYVKSRINSTEDFIRYTATQSSFSGKPYRVVCARKELLSKDWLTTELARFRQGKAQTGSAQAALK